MRNSGFFWKTLNPSKRFVLLFGLPAVLLFILAIATTIPRVKTGTRIVETYPQNQNEVLQRLNQDSDADGLKDWEEKIYGTNPYKSDTDQDSSSDGEEIKRSRNPLKSSPGDELALPLPPPNAGNRTQEIANKFIGENLTEIIARGAAGQPLDNLRQDSPDTQSFLAKISQENPLDKITRPSSDEFIVIQDNSPEAVKKYFNAVAQIYLTNFSTIESDLSILYDATTTNNMRIFRKLDANIAVITKAIEEIKRTPVPYKWLSFARDDVWYLSKTLAAVKVLRSSETDPAASLLVLRPRMEILDNFGNLYTETKTKLVAVGITFSKEEPAGQIILK